MKTKYEALIECRDAAGSDSQLARDLKITQPRVWRWVHQTKQMASEFVLVAERLYGVSRHDLDPHHYPRGYPPAPDANDRFLGTDQRTNGRKYMTAGETA